MTLDHHLHLCNNCNMGMRDLPDMYAWGPRAAGQRAEGIATYQANHEWPYYKYYVLLCYHSNNTSSFNPTSNCHTCL